MSSLIARLLAEVCMNWMYDQVGQFTRSEYCVNLLR